MQDYWHTEACSEVWLQAPGIPELVSDHLWGREWFLTQLGTRSQVLNFCWSVSGQDLAQLVSGQAAGSVFLASGVCPLVGETIPEGSASFQEGRACACPLLGGAGSWPSGGQGHV